MTTTTRVYRYGALAPTENAGLVAQQMRAAHSYRNTLTQIERGRRDAIRSFLLSNADVAECDRMAKLTDNAARDIAIVAKGKPELKPQLDAARNERHEATRLLFAARKKALTEGAERVDEINEVARALIRNAREYCGVYWGTYLLIEASVQQSAEMPLYDSLDPSDPRFERFTGEGRVGVQIQGGMSTAEVLDASDTRLRVVVSPPHGDSKRQQRRRHAMLWIRVGSDKRAPVWAQVPFLLHREIPADAVIRTATLTLRKVGWTERWSVEITIAIPAVQTDRTMAVAVDLGWRVIDDGIRVAKWVGEDGDAGEIRLNAATLSQLTKASSLRAIRDRNFNTERDLLAKQLGLRSPPAWMLNETQTLSQWRSQGRLAGLVIRWKNARWDGDDEAFAGVEAWRKQDRHLWDWESHQRMQGLDIRLKVFELAAATMAKKYGRLVLEKFNMLRVVRVSPDSTDQEDNARSNRQLVAPSILRNVLKNAFLARGCAVEEVSAAGSTRECCACGHTDEWDAAKTLEHTCSQCGTHWDQDENAAKVLLKRRSGTLQQEAAAPRGTKWKKAKAGADARKARQKAATP